jgi:hypothetical protein
VTDETQQNSEASAAFESGFSTARGNAPEAEKPAEKAETQIEAKPAARQDVQAEPDPWEGVAPTVREKIEGLESRITGFAKLPDRFRVLEGHIGNLNVVTRNLKAAMDTASEQSSAKGQEAPSNTEVQRAMKDPARWSQLEQDYPDWVAAVKPELDDLRAAIAAAPKSVPFDPAPLEKKFDERLNQNSSLTVAQARVFARIDAKHDDWEETVKSEDFKAWRAAQAPEINALGASSNAKDAIRMLDLYADHRKKEAEKVNREASRKKQLERAVAPDGVTVTTTPPSVEDAFVAGFKSARG